MTALLLGQGLQPLSGWLADRIGGRALVLGGVGLSTVSAAVFGWAHPVWLVLTLLLLTGIGNTAFHPQALSITRGLVGRRQGIGTSMFLVGGEIGRSLGPLAAGLVVSRLGLAWVWLLALPFLISLPMILRTIPPQPEAKKKAPPLVWRKHLKPALAMLAYSLVRSATIYEMITLAPLIWHQHGGSLVVGSALVSVLIGVGIVGNLGGGVVTDRVGKRGVLVVTSVLAILTLVAFIRLGGFWVWPILGVMGIALFGASAPTMLIGQDIFPENPGLGSGVALGLANGLGAVMVLPLTYVAAHWHAETAIWILVLFTLVTIPTIWGMPMGKRASA
jgi:FSR family fosmidomycin resistance protein-like MFS transporter